MHLSQTVFPFVVALALVGCTEPKSGRVPGDDTTTATTGNGPTFGTPGGGNGGGTTGGTNVPPVVDSDQDGDPDLTDCDDFDNDIHAGAPEILNGIDDDCDGEIDEDQDNSGAISWYLDLDHDGYGLSTVTIVSNVDPGADWSNMSGDCDDANALVHPGLTEITGNGLDDDCDASTVDAVLGSYWHYLDTDGDGYGAVLGGIQDASSSPPAGYVNNDDDCNDGSANAYPGAVEVVDGIDNDCDGSVDEGGGGLGVCAAGESMVTVMWTAPSLNVSGLTISGMVESGSNFFTPNYYQSNMMTGTPVGMVVTSTATTITASYSFCTLDGSRWEWSASYLDSIGTRRYSCEGTGPFVANGTWTVTIDGAPGPVPTTVGNGGTGCEHEFFQM